MTNGGKAVWLLVLSMSAALAACSKSSSNDSGKSSKKTTPVVNATPTPAPAVSQPVVESLAITVPAAGDASLIAIGGAPDGSYKLVQVTSNSQPTGTKMMSAVRHKLAAPGVISRDTDVVTSTVDWTGQNAAKKYNSGVEVQLPSVLTVVNGTVGFDDVHYYWQRQDPSEQKPAWYWSSESVVPADRKYIADVDFDESFRTYGVFQNGWYVNSRELAFTGYAIVGRSGSSVALQRLADGGLRIFVRYSTDLSYYSDLADFDITVQLDYRK